eukprot:CAMPEP_0183767126 /NCGR_PEP_ID=MMETSP0739-20130205/12002_1 /TAXON_ID=385413 /ORGANISM="Thalassiosira miniscula, Strain CCMP1093" /LENGTH=661 /DNA_ID=CAMNT_0026006001 /DNA_START=48 /DNA_END=2033 /DNA_ORIENTATION=+
MATASLSTLLWRATSSRSLFAVPSSSRASSSWTRIPSSKRRAIIASSSSSSCLAFQNNNRGAFFRRQPLATAFSNGSPRTLLTSSSSSSHLKSTPSPVDAAEKEGIHKPIPTILLAGFLGSGKTSTLKHLLENNSNIKIGTIVNDVASVNIDAKLIANSDARRDNQESIDGDAEGVVELQNGCACCSLADELFTSVVRLTKGGKRELDAIVVELSGVADPVAVRDNWKKAEMQGHPATRLASLTRTVTLIDACTFGTDWMTWDTAGERDRWTDNEADCAAVRKVPELLAEQVEAANLLLVNKIDLAGEKQVAVASGLARGLNDKASMMEVEFGRVEARELLGEMLGEEEEEEEEHLHDHAHSSHDHDHGHASEHDHDHSASACADPDCTDTSHSHSHEHSSSSSSSSSSECNDPGCTDTSHSHSHDHTSECDDPDCTDTSHSHSHDHKALDANHLGITSFVYSSSTPFNSQRLLTLLNRWPVPIKDDLNFLGTNYISNLEADQHPAFVGVLRSKGFCWMAPTRWSNAAGNDVWRHDTAMYWSHAGKHFGITTAGKWWGSLSKEQIKPYFANNVEEYERIMREDWVSEEWGDRRQELVFIGTNLDEEDIRKALDDCLCTDEEMVLYRAQLRNYEEAKFTAMQSGGGGGPSLFDVGGSDHIDQ